MAATMTQIQMTDKAVEKVNEIMEEQGKLDHALRMYVTGGGCSGLQYGLTFTEDRNEHDNVFPFQGFDLLVDPVSVFYLAGAHVDYIESMMGGGFKIDNPNASRTCGCGSSFAA